MSIFNELILPKVIEIPKSYVTAFNDDLKAAFACFHKFEEDFLNGKAKAREKTLKDKNNLTTLQSINEDEDEPKTVETKSSTDERSSTESASGRGRSKKRSKNEVDDMSSPEQEKRQKRNASVKAQSIISKQKILNASVEYVAHEVNVNLTQKLRRENSTEKKGRRRGKDDDKENEEPTPIAAVQIKQEKISIPPEPMELESIPLNVEVKQEKDEIAMPPPSLPVPKPRKVAHKDKLDDTSDEEPSRRRTTRTRKQTDTMPAPSTRATRASSRNTKQIDSEESVAEARPKRTRGKKATPETSTDAESISQSTVDSGISSPALKPRTKRVKKGQKQTETIEETPKPVEQPSEPLITPKEERVSQPECASPLLQKIVNKTNIANDKTVIIENVVTPPNDKGKGENVTETCKKEEADFDNKNLEEADETGVNKKLDATVTLTKDFDKTVDLPDRVENNVPNDPKNVRNMNETVVLETCNQTVVLDKPQHAIMDATVVIDKGSKTNLTEDNSLITDDDSIEVHTPPKEPPKVQPTSAVKEKVQQFEEMASRVTRTKTRALTKKVEDEPIKQTPPDKVSTAILSADTLTKMNSLIFNGKTGLVSSSASKPRAVTAAPLKPVPSSTSKLSGIRSREAEDSRREREDARQKKEALLEAKREMQKRRREEKMAAAAAARGAAERERRAALAAAARDRRERQLHADHGRLERLREAERKKQELARKVQETEERRKAEELARQLRLEDEQRRAEDARRRQREEADRINKEAALMAREIEKKQREFIEKQKMKQRMEEKVTTPLKTPKKYYHVDPVYMEDGFQYLNSDEEAEPVDRPIPAWSTSKARYRQLSRQCRVAARAVDALFAVRARTLDLRELFPAIDRARLKRTSSAVWRTPTAS